MNNISVEDGTFSSHVIDGLYSIPIFYRFLLSFNCVTVSMIKNMVLTADTIQQLTSKAMMDQQRGLIASEKGSPMLIRARQTMIQDTRI